ncbi:MAG: cysteine-rich CWC family protein [Bacteroidales bacterium]|nr:cysteine-rich CWC family protein [Bacteroidales bacterium]
MTLASRNKICPSCKATFQCMAEQDCWCESMQIHKKDWAVLLKKFTDCICPACLEKYSEK